MSGAARPGKRDAWIAAALALALGVLYALTFQRRFYNDGPPLTEMHVLGTRTFHTHVLYLPLCDLVTRVMGSADPLRALRLLSVVPAALGCGFAFLVLRTFGAQVFGALVAVLLLALSPALWFFATTIEVHALLFGTVTLVALVTLLAPWERRPRLALALVALLFPLLYWAHESAFVLGLGWVLLVQYARARHGTAFTWRGLLLGVGPLLLFTLLLGFAAANVARSGSLAGAVHSVRMQLAVPGYQPAPDRSVLLREWLMPLGVLVPLALLGARELRRAAWRAPAIAALVLFPLAFFAWWTVLERGGYFLGSDAFLLVPVGLFLGRWSRVKGILALVLLAGQATYARGKIDAFDRGWDPGERVAQVRDALGGSGLLLSTVGFAPTVHIDLPAVEEFSLRSFVRSMCMREDRLVPPEDVVAALRPLLLRLFERHERVALETGYRRVTVEDSPFLHAFRPSLAAIEAFLREHYRTSERPHEYWGLLVLERPE